MPHKNQTHNILAIDPGVAHTGICLGTFVNGRAVPVRVDLFETENHQGDGYKSADDLRRIRVVMEWLDSIMRKTTPRTVIAEIPIGGARSAAAVKYLAMATAVVAHLEVAHGIRVIQLTPTQVKQGFTGDKHADKPTMIGRALRNYPNVTGWPTKRGGALAGPAKLEHPADALAALIVGTSPAIAAVPIGVPTWKSRPKPPPLRRKPR